MQWLQAIALILLPMVGAWVAFKQASIAERKLNLDVYDKRFKVYEAARSLMGTFLREGSVTTKDILMFNTGVAEAPFLFGQDLVNYLDHLRIRAAALHTKTTQLSAMGEQDPRRDKLIDEIAALEQKLASEPERLQNAFKRYLNLGEI
jgi:hypothetical protein